MLISAGVSFIYKEQAATSFCYSAFITIVMGVIVFTPLRNEEKVFGKKEVILLLPGSGLFSLCSAPFHSY